MDIPGTNRSCQMVFTEASALRQHEGSDHTFCDVIKPRTGLPCNRKFAKPHSLQLHRNSVPSGKNFYCDVVNPTLGTRCNMTFAQRDGFTRHVKESHSGGKSKFHCDKIDPETGITCGAVLGRKFTLKEHVSFVHHPDLRTSRYQLCPNTRAYRRKSDLRNHMRVVHDIGGNVV